MKIGRGASIPGLSRIAGAATLLLALVCLQQTAALADAGGTAMLGGAAVPGLTAEQQKNCGQDCMYKRANENTLLQAQTIINELSYYGSKSVQARGFRDAHREFCGLNNAGGDLSCFKLYKAAQIRHLQNLRGNIVGHSDMAAKLNTFLANPDAQIEFTAGGGGSITPITPYAPTMGELGSGNPSGAIPGPQERVVKYRAWIDSISRPVDKSDPAFQQTEKVQSSRDRGVSYFQLAPDKTNDQSLKAAEEYIGRNAGDFDRLRKNAADQNRLEGQMIQAVENERTIDGFTSDAGERMKLKNGPIRTQAYGETRQIVIDAALGTKSPSSEANSNAPRAPAAAGSSPSSKYDQTLQQQADAQGVAQPKNFVLPNVDAIDEQVLFFEEN